MVLAEGKNLIALFVVFIVWTAFPSIPAWVTETQRIILALGSLLIIIALVTGNTERLMKGM